MVFYFLFFVMSNLFSFVFFYQQEFQKPSEETRRIFFKRPSLQQPPQGPLSGPLRTKKQKQRRH